MLNFVVAHSAEARPLIDFYKLTKNPNHNAFRIYLHDECRLVVSGQGKENIAAATSYLAALYCRPKIKDLWVNLGLAGHRSHPFGSLWRVNKITDQAIQRSIYPVAIKKVPALKACALTTVSAPETDYNEDCLYDMEASAFFHAAARFVTIEYVHSLKIISDNLESPLTKFNRLDAHQLIAPEIRLIDEYLNAVKLTLTDHYSDCDHLAQVKEEVSNKFFLTHSQKQIVNELISSLSVHKQDCNLSIINSLNAKALITKLKAQLKSIELTV